VHRRHLDARRRPVGDDHVVTGSEHEHVGEDRPEHEASVACEYAVGAELE
jgi:hypothetical protein